MHMKKAIKKQTLGFNLAIMGMVAAGKDTQATFVQNKYSLQPVETGEYSRKVLKEKSADGDLARRTAGKGLPLATSLMQKFLISQIENKPKKKDLIFIGGPRLKPEAQLVKKIFKHYGQNLFVIYISLPDKLVYKRSLGRDRGPDDDVKFIQSRIKWHKNQVSKTIAYFDSLHILKKINGNQTIEAVENDIEKAIESFKKQISK